MRLFINCGKLTAYTAVLALSLLHSVPAFAAVFGQRTTGVTTANSIVLTAPTATAVPAPYSGVGLVPDTFAAESYGVGPTGTFSYRVPIVLPPARRGMAPDLALTYSSSGAGSAYLGRGWSLTGLSAISRCGQTVAQDDRFRGVSISSDDQFCLDGQRLLLISGTHGDDGAIYKVEFNGGASRIVARKSANVLAGEMPEWFEVQFSDGRKAFYGDSAGSRLQANQVLSSEPYYVLRSGHRPLIWAISKVVDRDKNYFSVQYEKPSGGALLQYGVLRPSLILYSGNEAQADTPATSVEFVYDRVRANPKTSFLSGSRTYHSALLGSIRVNQGGARVAEYRLGYQEYSALSADYLDSLLAWVQRCSDSTNDSCMPAVTFGYTSASSRFSVATQGPANLDQSYYGSPDLRLKDSFMTDFNRDGVGDFLFAASGYNPNNQVALWFMINLYLSGGGVIERSLYSENGNYGVYFLPKNLLTGDVDRDGNSDLVYMGQIPAQNQFVPHLRVLTQRSSSDGSSATGWNQWSTSGGIYDVNESENLFQEFSDLNGDGFGDVVRADLVSAGNRIKLYVGKNKYPGSSDEVRGQLDVAGWFDIGPGHTSNVQSGLGLFPRDKYSGKSVDLTSDGLPDIVLAATKYITGSGENQADEIDVFYALNTSSPGVSGSMSFAAGVEWVQVPVATGDRHACSVPSWQFADVNGDGNTDLLGIKLDGASYTGTDAGFYSCVLVSRGNGTFEGPKVTLIQAGKFDASPLVADFNGDGRVDLILAKGNKSQGGWLSVAAGRGDGSFLPMVSANDADGWVASTTTTGWGGRSGTTDPVTFVPAITASGTGKIDVAFAQIQLSATQPPAGWGAKYNIVRYDVPTGVAGVGEYVGGQLASVQKDGVTVVSVDYLPTQVPASPQPADIYGIDNPSPITHNQIDLRGPAQVVSATRVPKSPAGQLTTSYRYRDGRINLDGRGFLGFGKVIEETSTPVTAIDGATTVVLQHVSDYEQAYPCTGHVKQDSRFANGVETTRTTSTVQMTSACGAEPAKPVSPVALVKQTAVSYSYNVDTEAAPSDVLSVSKVERNFDQYGNVTDEKAEVFATAEDISPQFTTQTQTTYKSTADYINAWLVGLPELKTVSRKQLGGVEIQYGKSAYTYNLSNTADTLHRVDIVTDVSYRKATEGDADPDITSPLTPYRLVTQYGNYVDGAWVAARDSYGNITKAIVSGRGAPAEAGKPDTDVMRATEYFYAAGSNYLEGTFLTRTRQTVSSYADGVPRSVMHEVSRTYNSVHGGVLAETAVDGTVQETGYDEFGRVVSSASKDRAGQTYDSVAIVRTRCAADCGTGEVIKVATSVPGTTTAYNYLDILGRQTRSVVDGFDGADIVTETRYNELGQVRCVSQPGFSGDCTGYTGWTHMRYDEYGRQEKVWAPDERPTTIAYTGLTTTTTNPLLQVRSETRDILGRVVLVADANGATVGYAYDIAGNLRQTTDANGNPVSMTYNPLGQKVSMTDPDMGAWSYRYDALGNQLAQTDAKGQVTTFVYDELGRLIRSGAYDHDAFWQYDTGKYVSSSVPGAAGVVVHDAVGALARAWKGTATVPADYERVQQYDLAGRPTATVYKYGQGGSTRIYTQMAEYDAQNRASALVYNPAVADYSTGAAQTVTPTAPVAVGYRNVYNSYGYLSQVTDYATPAEELWRANVRDAEGRVTSLRLGNGLTTRRSYSRPLGAMTGVMTGLETVPAGPLDNLVQNDVYGYDALGNLETRNAAQYNVQDVYTYDNLNRLESATRTHNGAAQVATYDHDAIGNLTYKSDVGTYSYAASTYCGGVHRVCSITNGATTPFNYDANGNLVRGNGRHYGDANDDGEIGIGEVDGWTSFNMPREIRVGSSVTETFLYGPDHERVKHEVTEGATTATTYYVNPRVDLGAHFEETVKPDGNGVPQSEYTHYLYAGGEIIGTAVVKGSPLATERRYFLHDHLGSIALVTDTDGDVLEGLWYDPWGRRSGLVGNGDNAYSPVWTADFGGDWVTLGMSPPAVVQTPLVLPLGGSLLVVPRKVIQMKDVGLIVRQQRQQTAYPVNVSAVARRYAESEAMVFSGTMDIVASPASATGKGYARLGVSNDGAAGTSLRQLYVVWEDGAFKVVRRDDNSPGADLSDTIAVNKTSGLWNVEIQTAPTETAVFVWEATQSRPATPTWSTTTLSWGGGASLTRALVVGGRTVTEFGAASRITVSNLTEWRAQDIDTLRSQFTANHGYTGHEHLEATGLIHMNGRVYDPLIGRFLSADPTVPDPFDLQSFNRFSYVSNNPLGWVDPSGHEQEWRYDPTASWVNFEPWQPAHQYLPDNNKVTVVYADSFLSAAGFSEGSYQAQTTGFLQDQIAQRAGYSNFIQNTGRELFPTVTALGERGVPGSGKDNLIGSGKFVFNSALGFQSMMTPILGYTGALDQFKLHIEDRELLAPASIETGVPLFGGIAFGARSALQRLAGSLGITKPLLPDNYWIFKQSPTQVTPGVRVVNDYEKPSSAGGTYHQTTHYDEFGRLIGRTDRTSHGDAATHPNPHHHRIDPRNGKRLKGPDGETRVWPGLFGN